VPLGPLVGLWGCGRFFGGLLGVSGAEFVLAFGFDLSSVGGFAWAFHAVALLRSSASCVLSEVGVTA
jgi:hypothetical protein